VRSSILFLGLAGCPYIFGPPDLSNTDADSGGTTTPGTVTGNIEPTEPSTTTGTNPNAPLLSSVVAAPRFDAVEISFRVDDPNGDLIGSTVMVDQGDVLTQYVVPADLEVWSQFGVSSLIVPKALSCDGYAEAWELTLTDAAGNASATVPVAATVRTTGILAAGDSDLGRLNAPATACGAIETLKPKQEDHLFFTMAASGQLTIELYWTDSSSDLDLYIFDGAVELAQSIGSSPAPEAVVVDLDAGGPYRLEVRYWDGPVTSWQLFIRE
jgi:hypothetical protein